MLAANPEFAAILLAAGTSSRFGPAFKLLHHLDGKPLIHHALAPILEAKFHQTITVTGHQADKLTPLINEFPIEIIFNKNHQDGMGASLAAGINALTEDIDAAFIFLADMPAITPAIINALKAALIKEENATICAPTYKGQRGHPVLFASNHFPALKALTGDQGAKDIIQNNAGTLCEVPVTNDAIFRDIDRPEDLQAYS